MLRWAFYGCLEIALILRDAKHVWLWWNTRINGWDLRREGKNVKYVWLSHSSKIRFGNIWLDDLFLAVILRFWMQLSSIMHLGHRAMPVKGLGVLGRNYNWINAYQKHVYFCCPTAECNSSNRPIRRMWAYIHHTSVVTPYLWSATFTSLSNCLLTVCPMLWKYL